MVKRKPYQKPEIKQVDLAPEEAVLTGCKLAIAGGNPALLDGTYCYKNTSKLCSLAGS